MISRVVLKFVPRLITNSPNFLGKKRKKDTPSVSEAAAHHLGGMLGCCYRLFMKTWRVVGFVWWPFRGNWAGRAKKHGGGCPFSERTARKKKKKKKQKNSRSCDR